MLGMLIAIPVAASIKSIIDYFYPPEHYEGLTHKQLDIEVEQVLENKTSPTFGKEEGLREDSDRKRETFQATGQRSELKKDEQYPRTGGS